MSWARLSGKAESCEAMDSLRRSFPVREEHEKRKSDMMRATVAIGKKFMVE
jgi:hypothetical protein